MRVERLWERISRIDFDIEPDGIIDPDTIALVKTYLRSVASFFESRGTAAKLGTPFFSPAWLVSQHQEAADLLLPAERQWIRSRPVPYYDYRYLQYALEWARLCDSGHGVCQDNEEIFEPVVALVERRFFMKWHHGEFLFGPNGMILLNPGWACRLERTLKEFDSYLR